MAERGERSGWFLKKEKTAKSWARASHSHRFFVTKGAVLCYYERQVSGPESAGLKGVIDLREVQRLRPSTDTTAPAYALDMVLPGRTYVLVPQPPMLEEQRAWVQAWVKSMCADAVAAELLGTQGSTGEVDSSAPSPFGAIHSDGPSHMSLPTQSDQAAPLSSALGGGAYACTAPGILMQGFLLKQPMRSERKRSATSLLNGLAMWKRRRLVLRHGLLQWYTDDPDAGSFLGVLRLSSDTVVELTNSNTRLQVRTADEMLNLRDDDGELVAWQRALAAHVAELAHEGGRQPPGAHL